MRRHVPSKPDDLDFDAREVAKAAARRAGLSLEEWAAAVLNRPNGTRESFPAHFRQPNDIAARACPHDKGRQHHRANGEDGP